MSHQVWARPAVGERHPLLRVRNHLGRRSSATNRRRIRQGAAAHSRVRANAECVRFPQACLATPRSRRAGTGLPSSTTIAIAAAGTRSPPTGRSCRARTCRPRCRPTTSTPTARRRESFRLAPPCAVGVPGQHRRELQRADPNGGQCRRLQGPACCAEAARRLDLAVQRLDLARLG